MQFLQVSPEPMLSQEPRENLSSRPAPPHPTPAWHVLCGAVLSTAEFILFKSRQNWKENSSVLLCFVFQKQILFLGNASFRV